MRKVCSSGDLSKWNGRLLHSSPQGHDRGSQCTYETRLRQAPSRQPLLPLPAPAKGVAPAAAVSASASVGGGGQQAQREWSSRCRRWGRLRETHALRLMGSYWGGGTWGGGGKGDGVEGQVMCRCRFHQGEAYGVSREGREEDPTLNPYSWCASPAAS